MPFQISRSYLDGHSYGFMSRRPGRAGGKLSKSEMTEKAIGAATVAGTAFALGAVEAKYGMYAFDSGKYLTADLVLGVGLHALGFFGMTGGYESYANNIANGALAYYAGIQGARIVTGPTGGKTSPGLGKAAGSDYPMMAQGERPAMSPEQVWAMQFR